MVFRIWCWNTRGRARQTLFPARKKPVARYGIDPGGANYSVKACLDTGETRLGLRGLGSQPTTRSVVSIDEEDRIWVGGPAPGDATKESERVARGIKRL